MGNGVTGVTGRHCVPHLAASLRGAQGSASH